MLRKILKNKRAQNTAEYAILISLVVAGIIAMQTYAQRALQARVRDAAQFLTNVTSDLGNTVQYEPYYLTTDYNVVRDEVESQFLDDKVTRTVLDINRMRESGGFQESSYDNGVDGIQGGL